MLQEQIKSAVAESSGSMVDRMTSEFLTIRLGNEEYGIEILKVQAIRG
jgi:chemotaxis signal transduction protein